MADMQIPDDPLDRFAPIIEAVNAIKTWEPPVDVVPDLAERCRQVEVDLGDWRKANTKRAVDAAKDQRPVSGERITAPSKFDRDPAAVGRKYQLEPQYTTDREYNSPAIILAFTDGRSWQEAFDMLRRAGAFTLAWSWDTLKKVADGQDVKLTRLRFGDWWDGVKVEATGDNRRSLRADMRAKVNDDAGTDAPMIGELRYVSTYKRVPIKGEDE